ncbi:olfactory receptor 6N1-like [Ascaphus truei]|uniref:olfactory receptor 6N1-like n=1 Tax=Ascaphus truei TaxID=8439 RepID=UPI003F597997
MESNQSITEFIIVGFSNISSYHPLLFTLLLLLYFVIIIGNAVISFLILCDPHLHLPMYFFICTLSILEMVVTAVYPTLFAIVLEGKARISFSSCLLQMYIFHSLVITENYLLSIMAYDRYVAICNSLRYHAIMTSKFCKALVSGCWLFGFMTPLLLLILVSRMPFCGSKEIHHLFCDSSPLLTLACADNSLNVIVDLAISSLTIIVTSIFILMTYTKILVAIMKMRTAEERRKAFSTCASHLIVVLVFYGSVAFMYIQLQISYSPAYDLATAIHHSLLTPLFSPIIYSLRSKEIKNSLKKYFKPKRIFNRNVHVATVLVVRTKPAP